MPKVKKQYKDNKKIEIIKAAKACFVEKGFHKTTVNDILKACSISAGGFYIYFKSKDQIIISIIEEEMNLSIQNINNILLGFEKYEISDELLVSFFSKYISENVIKECKFELILWTEAIFNDQVKDLLNEKYQEFINSFSNIIIKLQKAQIIDKSISPVSMAQVFVSLRRGLSLQLAIHGDILNVEEYVKTISKIKFL